MVGKYTLLLPISVDNPGQLYGFLPGRQAGFALALHACTSGILHTCAVQAKSMLVQATALLSGMGL